MKIFLFTLLVLFNSEILSKELSILPVNDGKIIYQKVVEVDTKYTDSDIFNAVKNYYKEPIVVSEAKGSRVKDLDGKSYLDFFQDSFLASIFFNLSSIDLILEHSDSQIISNLVLSSFTFS